MTCQASDCPCMKRLRWQQNVTKYARHRRPGRRSARTASTWRSLPADAGTGSDRAAIPIDTRLQGVTDRLAALNGNIDITLSPGRATQVTDRIPATTRRHQPDDRRDRSPQCRDTSEPGDQRKCHDRDAAPHALAGLASNAALTAAPRSCWAQNWSDLALQPPPTSQLTIDSYSAICRWAYGLHRRLNGH
jgi:hypothetical protein